ncbi:calcium-binding protein CML39-like [Gastrolobium bilobum]|uniref:calcium-binding protein CML39-like n=1 Tax=Gastrolobium bilobum TaxID=150636 RepID=UPI002AB0B8D4|nr:calcium-binding protein CML39-like [Gastrolobium bilobum]
MAFKDRDVPSDDGKRVMTLQQFKQWLKTSFDTNRDGQISKAELSKALRQSGVLFSSWKSNKALKFADTDHDGFIEENEFNNLSQFVEKNFNVKIIK